MESLLPKKSVPTTCWFIVHLEKMFCIRSSCYIWYKSAHSTKENATSSLLSNIETYDYVIDDQYGTEVHYSKSTKYKYIYVSDINEILPMAKNFDNDIPFLIVEREVVEVPYEKNNPRVFRIQGISDTIYVKMVGTLVHY